MQRSLEIIAVLAALAFITAGCGKDGLSPVVNANGVPEGYLVEITQSDCFDADSLYGYIGSMPSPVIGFDIPALGKLAEKIYLKNLAELELRNYIDVGVDPDYRSKLRFERHRFTYNSTDAEGKPVLLSGSVFFPTNTDAMRRFEVRSLTMFNNPYLVPYDSFAEISGLFVILRVLFNSAVVVPDLEGYGVTYGKRHPVDMGYNCVGHQAVDCELAAMELMAKRGVTMQKGYGTYNMGTSRGGFIAMSVHKFLETEASEAVRKAISLKNSYCTGVPFDTFGLLKHYAGGTVPIQVMVANMVGSLYYSCPETFKGVSYNELFSDAYNSSDYALAEYGYTLNELMELMKLGYFEFNEVYEMSGIYGTNDMLSPRFFNEYGEVDMDSDLAGIIRKASEENDPSRGWSPQADLLIKHSRNDDIVPFSFALEAYERLSVGDRGIPNRHVFLEETAVPGHLFSSLEDVLTIAGVEDPAGEYFN